MLLQFFRSPLLLQLVLVRFFFEAESRCLFWRVCKCMCGVRIKFYSVDTWFICNDEYSAIRDALASGSFVHWISFIYVNNKRRKIENDKVFLLRWYDMHAQFLVVMPHLKKRRRRRRRRRNDGFKNLSRLTAWQFAWKWNSNNKCFLLQHLQRDDAGSTKLNRKKPEMRRDFFLTSKFGIRLKWSLFNSLTFLCNYLIVKLFAQ